MNFRIVARLDIKNPYVVKGVHLEGFKKVGSPQQLSRDYFNSGADEIHYQDIVASLYNRNSILATVQKVAETVFIPLTVGGGIRKLADVDDAMRSGADKVVVNTGAVQDPDLIRQVSRKYGAQSVVLGLEVMEFVKNQYSILIKTGREKTNLSLEQWIKKAVSLGVGELFVTSVKKDGTFLGIDFLLLKKVREYTKIPIIIHGGTASEMDCLQAYKNGADGVAIASLLHYQKKTIPEIKRFLHKKNVPVRK